MVFHLVAISKHEDNAVGYLFSARQISSIKDDLNSLYDDTKSAGIDTYAVHVFSTDSYDSRSIIDYDDYFADIDFTTSKKEFIEQITNQLLPTSSEIASYIEKKFSLRPFALMKTVYYLYADYLELHKTPLFKAEFEAWTDGPVDRSVYRLKKHEINRLKNMDDVRIKQSGDFQMLAYIDKFVENHADYLDSIRFSEENPTHREGTPWSYVMKYKGKNNLITDDDIIKFHDKEKILS